MNRSLTATCTAPSSMSRIGSHIRSYAATQRLNSTATPNPHGPNSKLIQKLTQGAQKLLY